MAELLSEKGTRTDARTEAQLGVSGTRTIDEIVEGIGFVRSRARLLGEDVVQVERQTGLLHRRAFDAQLNARARDVARRPALDILEELASCGFAWRDIARMVGVSVPALRRWRQGERPNASHLLAIARLLALVEVLRADHLVSDVAGWMEMPLVPEAPVTGVDLVVAGRLGDLVDVAAQHARPEDVLDGWQPGWRDRYRSDFEVFEAPDGELGIRPVLREGL